jgi:transposase
MARRLTVRKPTLAEFRRLNQCVQDAPTPRQQRAAQVLVLHYLGMNAQDIARSVGVHPNTVYADLHAFGQHGLASIRQTPPRMGTPPRLQEAQVREVRRLAEMSPVDLGEPYGHWSLATLRAYLIRHHILKAISREHLRQVLKKGASISDTSSAN